MKSRKIPLIVELIAVFLCSAVFVTPFLVVFVGAGKDQLEAAAMRLSLPTTWHLVDNFLAVLSYQHGIVLRAFMNSTILTAFSVVGIVLVSSMAGFVMQRRKTRYSGFLNFLIITGLVIPPPSCRLSGCSMPCTCSRRSKGSSSLRWPSTSRSRRSCTQLSSPRFRDRSTRRASSMAAGACDCSFRLSFP